MRYINKIIVHCTATEAGADYDIEDVRRWHTQPPPAGNGWRDVGYHYLIKLDGTVQRGRAISQPGAHCYGQNAHSIGVCYVGGLLDGKPADTRTREQKSSLLKLLANLSLMYRCRIFGHRDFANKECPCFDAKSEYAGLYDKFVLH